MILNPIRNVSTGVFPKAKFSEDIVLPIQDVSIHFLKKLQEADEFLEQPIIVSSATDELRIKNIF